MDNGRLPASHGRLALEGAQTSCNNCAVSQKYCLPLSHAFPTPLIDSQIISAGASMKKAQIRAIAFAAIGLGIFGGIAFAQQDKYALKVPGGLAFSEFRGYEGWQVVATSQNAKLVAVILAIPR